MPLSSIDSFPPIADAHAFERAVARVQARATHAGDGALLSPGARGVHVLYTRYSNVVDRDRMRAYQAIMSAAERDRMHRFVFERDRWQFAITRALVRRGLSLYAPVHPRAWQFAEGDHGKPHVDTSAVTEPRARDLWFNLSNTRGLIACAITRVTPEVGVDVEDISRAGGLLDVADRYFSRAEVAALFALPVAEQNARFFVYWTLKESYIKARGLGLSLPLQQFSFHVDDDRSAADSPRIRIACDPALGDRDDSWQFWLGHVDGTHYLALGARRPGSARLEVSTRAWIP